MKRGINGICSQFCPAAPRGFRKFCGAGQGGAWPAFRGAGQPVFLRGGVGRGHHPIWNHQTGKKGSFEPRKTPFGAPEVLRGPQGQIRSQLPPIGLLGLDSLSPHTLTWYRAPFGPKGALKGLVLATKGPFGDLGGPRRAPVGQIWSQLPSNGLMGLNLWSPHTLT